MPSTEHPLQETFVEGKEDVTDRQTQPKQKKEDLSDYRNKESH